MLSIKLVSLIMADPTAPRTRPSRRSNCQSSSGKHASRPPWPSSSSALGDVMLDCAEFVGCFGLLRAACLVFLFVVVFKLSAAAVVEAGFVVVVSRLTSRTDGATRREASGGLHCATFATTGSAPHPCDMTPTVATSTTEAAVGGYSSVLALPVMLAQP